MIAPTFFHAHANNFFCLKAILLFYLSTSFAGTTWMDKDSLLTWIFIPASCCGIPVYAKNLPLQPRLFEYYRETLESGSGPVPRRVQ
jgi:hypothetical protein